ncbi:hypothetical protein JTE90_018468, partial [Oedothorax gibbosus]
MAVPPGHSSLSSGMPSVPLLRLHLSELVRKIPPSENLPREPTS